ncbi:alpha/beta fold hydrolase [Candidatus Sumerlaeota bacterium]|nr:alpha/beta fold hydrolase [Candidatus Sumerlaeota bacterium]
MPVYRKMEWRWIVFFLFLFSIGLIGKAFLPDARLFKEHLSLENSNGFRIEAMIYGKKGNETATAQPAAVLCHGISCSKELMNTIGRDLALNGFLVMAFDYGSHGESAKHPVSEEECLADVLCAIEAVRKNPRVDGSKIVLAGHSMGAVSASMAGTMDRNIRAVVCLGQKGVGNGEYPRNMLQAYGLYDQYHTVPSMKRSLSEISGVEKIIPVKAIRDISPEKFTEPGNKALLIVPDGDHSSEVYSVNIIPEIRNWMRLSVGLEPVYARSVSAWGVYFDFCMVFGIFGTGIILLSGIRKKNVARFIALLPAVLTFGSFLLFSETPYANKASLILTIVYLVISIGLYNQRRGDVGVGGSGLIWIKGFLLVAASFCIGSLLGAFDQAIRNGNYLLWAPLVLPNIMIHRLHFILNILRADLFMSYSWRLVPRYWFGILLILEPFFPGLVWRPIGWLATKIKRSVTGARFKFSLGSRDKRSFIVLGILTVVAIAVIMARWKEGLLGIDSLGTAGAVIFRMYLMPLIVLISLIRVANRGSDSINL